MTRQDPLLKLVPEEYSRTRDDHELGGGYRIRHSREDFAIEWRFLDVHRHGACIVRVAGTEQRPVELQLDDFAPGRSVQLRAEPGSPDGPDVIGVWDGTGLARAGRIARQNLPDARALLFSGEPVQALVVWDWRTQDGTRTGLNVLIARPGVVKDLDVPAWRFERPPPRRTVATAPVVAVAVVAWVVLASLFGIAGVVVGGVVVVLAILGTLNRR